MAKKYYAVRKGKTTGIFTDWDTCKEAVTGYSGAEYKGFVTAEEAKNYLDCSTKPELDESTAAIAYVDGSYNINTKKYSYGVVFLYQGKEVRFNKAFDDKELATMRNVAGEIAGSMAAMQYAVKCGIPQLVIYHDYEGIAAWCEGRWQANKEGTKGYKQYFDSLKGILSVKFVKVKGHSGDQYNEIADQLAKEAIF